MLSTSVILDLAAAVYPDRMRRAIGELDQVPDGTRVIVRIGTTVPEPSVSWLLARHEPRLCLDLQGAPRAVGAWYGALVADAGEVGR
ncbi:hypothetical protein [Nocardioides massiliensis]|uniref:Uncharacterized protein n=1 Tax=Nocardioides massiliensis TaxID=1325935 RepID=A0ABT9NQS0_9ACTN|nr:hypothetical protein [Nocardioides massiliensis]MDP9822774.1 hypothetical protein [Nocardioides massiliensis]